MGAVFFNTVQNSLTDLENARSEQQDRWDQKRQTSIEVVDAEIVLHYITIPRIWPFTLLDQLMRWVLEGVKWNLVGLNWGLYGVYFTAEKISDIIKWIRKGISSLDPILEAIEQVQGIESRLSSVRIEIKLMAILLCLIILAIIPPIPIIIGYILRVILVVMTLFLFMGAASILDMPLLILSLIAIPGEILSIILMIFDAPLWSLEKLTKRPLKMKSLVGRSIGSIEWLLSSPASRGLRWGEDEAFGSYLWIENKVSPILPWFMGDVFDDAEGFIYSRAPYLMPKLVVEVENTGNVPIGTHDVDIIIDGVYMEGSESARVVSPGDSFTITISTTEMPNRIKVVTPNGVSDYWFG